MDVRDSANPVLARARRWLARVNARHPWNHNEHFHGWILRNLPARRRAAVDVGCGTGVLTGKLAPHFARVTGIDADAGMAAAASARLAQDPRVTIRRCGFEEFAAAAGDGEADLITMVAVLHHLGLDDTLARIPGLLAPGGRLLVVGLARVNSLPDLAVDLISAAANPVMGLIRHPRPARPAEGPAAGQPVMPVRDPPHYPGGDHRSGQGPPAGRHRPAALVLPLLSALGQAADDRTTAGLWQPRSPVNHRTADRPAHRTRTPRRAQAGGGSPRRVQVADYRVCPLPVGARRASPPLGTPAPTTAPVR